MCTEFPGRSAELYQSVMDLIRTDDSRIAIIGALGAATATVLEDAQKEGLPAEGLFAGFCAVVSNIFDGRDDSHDF
jgi:hypothetical protein